MCAHFFSLSLGSARCGPLPCCLCEARLVAWVISHAGFSQLLGEQSPERGSVLGARGRAGCHTGPVSFKLT